MRKILALVLTAALLLSACSTFKIKNSKKQLDVSAFRIHSPTDNDRTLFAFSTEQKAGQKLYFVIFEDSSTQPLSYPIQSIKIDLGTEILDIPFDKVAESKNFSGTRGTYYSHRAVSTISVETIDKIIAGTSFNYQYMRKNRPGRVTKLSEKKVAQLKDLFTALKEH